jgi:hypothetical protein
MAMLNNQRVFVIVIHPPPVLPHPLQHVTTRYVRPSTLFIEAIGHVDSGRGPRACTGCVHGPKLE